MTLKTTIVNKKIVIKDVSAQINDVDILTSTTSAISTSNITTDIVYGTNNVINLSSDVVFGGDINFINANVASDVLNTASAANLYITITLNGSGFALPLYRLPFALGHVQIGQYTIY